MEDIRSIITLLESRSSNDKIEIIDLGYSENALSPVISGGSMRYHYGKLAHAYAERYNSGTGDKTFNYAGAWLHNMYFMQFRAPRISNKPNGPIGNLINSKFKNWDNFVEQFTKAAANLHGSGWLYLARDGSIKIIHNHQVRPDILILVDLWEHAYNLDYSANKDKYLQNIWRIMDWGILNTRWGKAYTQ